ncbi:MAG: NADH-quinone oxidoreductase subunit NuoE [Actinobacteria bacterium]|nr:NADH-quinone oxidoreductase subunit NuoE [Actinomycetota bacterium]
MSSANFTSEQITKMDQIIARYPRSRSAVMPLLHYVQSIYGYVTDEGIEFIGKKLDLATAEVNAVASFYTQYKRKPVGEYHIGICTNTLCAVMGGDAIYSALKDQIGSEHDGVSADGKVSLEHIECNAACDYAPVMMVNWEFYDNQTVESAKEFVEKARTGNPPAPTRGPKKLRTWKENSEVLAGFSDGLANEGISAGKASLLGLSKMKNLENN